jgi:hypothetical protein
MIIINNPPKPPAWVRFKDYFLVLLLLVAIILLFRECGKRTTWEEKAIAEAEAGQRKVDSLQKALADTVKAKEARVKYWQDSAEVNLADATVYRYERDEAWKGLERNKKDADKLIANIRNSQGKDTADCLELTEKYVDAAGQVVKYKAKSDQLVNKLDSARIYTDSALAEQKRLTQSALNTGHEVAKAYSSLHAQFDRIKPHASVWGGFETTVTPGSVLAGPTAAFQTKRGMQYQLGAGLDSRDVQYYVSGKILWKISFKKK